MNWFKNYRVTIGWGLAILILSLFPGQFLPGIPDFYQLFKPDKIIHLVLFGTLAYLLLQSILEQYGPVFFRYYGVVTSLLTGIIYGGLTEYLQHITRLNRSGNVYDFIANTLGCIIGAIVFLLLKKKAKKRECRLEKC
jgi:VanZ family protein